MVAGKRHDFRVEAARACAGGGALLRLQGVFVLRLARDAVALGDDFGGLEHRHVEVGTDAHEPGSLPRKRLMCSFCTSEIDSRPPPTVICHAVGDDLLGRGGDRHQAGGALPIHRHAGDA